MSLINLHKVPGGGTVRQYTSFTISCPL